MVPIPASIGKSDFDIVEIDDSVSIQHMSENQSVVSIDNPAPPSVSVERNDSDQWEEFSSDDNASNVNVSSVVLSSASTTRNLNSPSTIKEVITKAFAKLESLSLLDEHFLMLQLHVSDKPIDITSSSGKNSPMFKWKRSSVTIIRDEERRTTSCVQAHNYFSYFIHDFENNG